MLQALRHTTCWVVIIACTSHSSRDLAPDATDSVLTAPQGASVSQTIICSGAARDLELLASASGDEEWLTYKFTTKDDLAAIIITADSTGMGQGEYSATLDISAAGYKAVRLPITFTVTPPELRFEPTTLSVTLIDGDETDREVVLTSTLPFAAAAVTIATDADWLTASPVETNGTLALHLDTGALAVAGYAGAVRASQHGFVDALLPVSFEVAPDCIKTLEISFKSTSRIDLGWKGTGFDTMIPTGRITLGATCPTGTPCGDVCALTGLVDNSVIAGRRSNRRCVPDTFNLCTSDSDCRSGKCRYLLPPMTVVPNGGRSGCVVPYFEDTLTGSFNLTSGAGVADATTLIASADPSSACSYCVDSVCQGGYRNGSACVIDGTTLWGDTSLDCPTSESIMTTPSNLPLALPEMTINADSTWTLSSAQPACRGIGLTGTRCFCSTCNNAVGQPCSAHSDCPLSGSCAGGANQDAPCSVDANCPASFCRGNPCVGDQSCAGNGVCLAGYCSTTAGFCGGPRCVGGENAGAPCLSGAACASGSCGVPGELTRPNTCFEEGCDARDSMGLCLNSSVDTYCSTSTFMACVNDGDCPGEETCVPRLQACWRDNGTLGTTIATELATSSLASEPSFGALLCIASTLQAAINEAVGLPGPARLRLYTDVTLHE